MISFTTMVVYKMFFLSLPSLELFFLSLNKIFLDVTGLKMLILCILLKLKCRRNLRQNQCMTNSTKLQFPPEMKNDDSELSLALSLPRKAPAPVITKTDQKQITCVSCAFKTSFYIIFFIIIFNDKFIMRIHFE